MSLVTANQLAAERALTGETFTDTAQRLVFGATDSDYGPGTVEGYTAGASFACSFQGRTRPDAQGETEVPITEADLYLAHDAVLDPEDRVTITHLYGEAVAEPQVFDIVEGPLADGNVTHVVLRLITDGSSDEVEN